MAGRRGTAEGVSWSLVLGVAVVCLVVGYLIGVSGQRQSAVDRTGGPEVAMGRASSTSVQSPARSAAAAESHDAAHDRPETRAESEPAPAPAVGTDMEPPSPSPVSATEPIPSGKGSRVALVIDDLGRSVQDVADLSALGVPISFAVLPFESRTAEVVRALDQQGSEVLLHLPMQPSNGADPGPGALTSGMNEAELEAATLWALDAVRGAAGVNNHMGSELSADGGRMRTILGVLAERDLFFLDSRTSAKSVGYRVALDLGLAAAQRQVFLDPDPQPQTIRTQFVRLLELARSRGAAVAIGHPYPATLEVLREQIPRAVDAGYEFVTVSELTHRQRATNAR